METETNSLILRKIKYDQCDIGPYKVVIQNNKKNLGNLHPVELDLGPDLSDTDSIEPFEGSSDEYRPDDSFSESINSNNLESEELERTNEVSEDLFIVPESLPDIEKDVHRLDETAEINHQPIPPNIRKKKYFSPKIKTSKKRKRKPEQWVKRKAALSREKGQSYKSYKGEDIAAKSVAMGNLCPDKCRLKCSDKFTIEQRENIMFSFYKLDINGKNALLFNSIRSSSPGRKRKGATNHKTATYQYFLTLEKKQTLVCKRAFISLYQISKKKMKSFKIK
ncbi:unnamed protein product [Psylliodes chrysocephalus]|uniref:Uncharacterized protein n=1 Tax=Psylliodes chrysocephalus TaxID=3402493 RepID=A0A9P0GM27_9CUCU|nr:unnamed protein product [Psylliodes chrysocephala]